ncbi:hypothetical protein J2X05_004202 [Cellvibrio fibrivorans]|uniref:Uncharacterized protein n=1 Tax=Cellvibrio fibrivorans TaxID=126350 RepID=A0ABU1V3V5_9GAMM|nr:hypothetical protein [Cellvibrio fibrivorans]
MNALQQTGFLRISQIFGSSKATPSTRLERIGGKV